MSADTTGDNVKLFCWLDGFAPKNVQVTWYENGQELKNNPPKKTFQLSDKSSKVFSILSEISTSKEKWNKDTEFKCEVKHRSWKFESTLSMCKGYQTHKPLIHLEKPSLESILKETPVIVSCVVETPLNAKVSWFEEGNSELKETTEKRLGEIIVSNLTVNFEQWKLLKTLTCKAVHKCFTEVEVKINIKEPIKTSPTAVIKRNLADLEKENATVLECVATDLPSGELAVTFQYNGRTTFETQYFKMSENMDTHTARVTIENYLQTKENNFTCEIQQSDSTKWTSKSTGKLFDDPSVELSAIHSTAGSTSQTQKLLCIGTGFNPKIKWDPASTGNVRTQVTMQADGRVQVFSENTVQQQEWSSGTDFKCEVSEQDPSKKREKSINVCAAYSISKPLIRLEKPSLKSILTQSQVIASCVVETPLNAKVSWFKEGNSELKETTEKRLGEIIVSNLTIDIQQWKILQTLTCKAVHKCFNEVEIKINIEEPIKTSTKVVIRRNLADLEKGNAAVLECAGTDLPSGELEVTFKVNGGTPFGTQYFKMSENMDTLTARVTIENEHQTKENTFTCQIQQSDSAKWTSKSTGKLFDDPSVELSAIHSKAGSTSQTPKLLCIGTGLNPKIKWDPASTGNVRTQVTMQADGRVQVFSENTVQQQEWSSGTDFKCEVSEQDPSKKREKSINVCAAYSISKPLIRLEKPSLKSILTQSQVIASCVVETPLNAKVSWFKEGNSELKETTEKRLGEIIVSNLTIDIQQWKILQTLTCKAVHKCFNEVEIKINIEEPIKTSTKVVIRRNLADLEKGNAAVLECAGTDLPSGELEVTFKVNGGTPFGTQYFKMSENMDTLTARVTIENEHQTKENTFTCQIQQSDSAKWTSKSTGKLFDDPSVELSAIHSKAGSTSQTPKLLCIGTGLNPKIKWVPASTGNVRTQVTMQADGRVQVFSENTVQQQEWSSGTDFKCEVSEQDPSKKREKSINVCAAYSISKPLIRLEKPSLKSILTQSQVIASCVVETPLNAKVSWFKEGNSELKETTEKRLGEIIVSNLTIDIQQWKLLQTLTCKAVHKCFNEVEIKINIEEPIKTSPKVVIRRNLADLEKGNGAVLECAGKDLPSGELAVTFQATGGTTFETQYFKMSENMDTHTARVTIENKLQTKENTFTCEIQQSDSAKWTSKSTGKLFDDPSVELSAIHSKAGSTSQTPKLLCIGTGLNPKIKWVPASTGNVRTQVTMQADGRVQVFSENTVQQQEWSSGTDFKCEVSEQDSSKKAVKNISVCADFNKVLQVYLSANSIGNRKAKDDVSVTCRLLGLRLTEFTITWKVGKNGTPTDVRPQKTDVHRNGTESVDSVQKVPDAKWNSFETIFCEVMHPCFKSPETYNISKTKDPKIPTVRILSPSDQDLLEEHSASLVCFISGFYPADISVHWEQNGQQLDASRFTNSSVSGPSSSGSYFMYSALKLQGSERQKCTFSCVVRHESSEKRISDMIDNVYASVQRSDPSMDLLQDKNQLVCVVYDYSPSAINITWLLNSVAVGHMGSNITSAKRPDGKFIIKSHLKVHSSEWAPGHTYTCHVEHATGIKSLNITKTEFIEKMIYFDENKEDAITMDQAEETWNMACAFIILFIITLVYGCSVTLVKVKST